MKRNRHNDYLLLFTILIFLICLVEGFVYYHNDGNIFVQFALNALNAIKTYTVDPEIGPLDAMEYYWQNPSLAIKIITYLYCAAVIMAPICTVGAVFVLFRRPASYVKGLLAGRRQHSFLIIGDGEEQLKFVSALAKECRVYMITGLALDEDQQRELIELGVHIIQKYQDISDEKILLKVNLRKYDNILLCDEDPLRNTSFLNIIRKQYDALDHTSLRKQQQIYVLCSDPSVQNLVYQRCSDFPGAEVRLLDVKKKAVDRMLIDNPLYRKPNGELVDSSDVHLGILGFGEFGQNTLIEALNMAVMDYDSKIRIDIFDKNIDQIIGDFMNRFSTQTLDGLRFEQKEIIKGEYVGLYSLDFPVKTDDPNYRLFDIDGQIEIRFWDIDAGTLQFNGIFEDCQREMPFTYIVLCMSEIHDMMDTILDLRRMLCTDEHKDFEIPVLVRTKTDGDAQHLSKPLILVGDKHGIYSYESIKDDATTIRAKIFNYRYNCVYEGQEFDLRSYDQLSIEFRRDHIDNAWQKMTLFKRESSIAQAMHQDVKANWILKQPKYEQENMDNKEELEMIEHRRWNLFMITHGYRYAVKRDDTAFHHDCISSWEHLKAERPDTLEYDYTPFLIARRDKKK